jgi:nucleoid DNA-binding protein
VADPSLIGAIVAAGVEREAAEDMLARVTTAMVDRLLAGKTVRLDGIGSFKAPKKVVRAGFPPDHFRQQRKIELRTPGIIEKGEPYAL